VLSLLVLATERNRDTSKLAHQTRNSFMQPHTDSGHHNENCRNKVDTDPGASLTTACLLAILKPNTHKNGIPRVSNHQRVEATKHGPAAPRCPSASSTPPAAWCTLEHPSRWQHLQTKTARQRDGAHGILRGTLNNDTTEARTPAWRRSKAWGARACVLRARVGTLRDIDESIGVRRVDLVQRRVCKAQQLQTFAPGRNKNHTERASNK
jgi:hypothetical protein